MSVPALTLVELAPLMRDAWRQAMKDKSYRSAPIGQDAGRFLRSLRWGDSSQNTLDTYETVLARFALDHFDRDLDSFCSPTGAQDLTEFLERHWGDSANATKRNRHAILSSFFRWAARERRIPWNPMDAVKPPKGKSKVRLAHPRHEVRKLLAGQESLRDQCALGLLCWLGLRKMDLGGLQIRDIDLTRNVVVLRDAKGGGDEQLPVEHPDLRQDLYLHIVVEGRLPAEFLLHPKRDRMRPMDPSSVHRWFKRCLEMAGLPDFPMHELRHTAGDEIWRTTGNLVLAQQLLRHKSIETTRRYLHPSPADLRAGMHLVYESWQEEDE